MIKHEITEEDIYEIRIDDKKMLEIELDKELDQIIIRTGTEVWAGPIKLLTLSNFD